MLPKVQSGKRALIVAEKPDEGTRIAAALGGVMIDNQELTEARLNNDAFAAKVKKHRFKGYFEGRDKNGTPYLITWGFGHLYQLFQAKDYNPAIKWNLADFPFFPETYRYKPMADKVEQVKKINGWMTDAQTDYIICATDPDREGEGIFALMYNGARAKKKVYRLWLDDLTPEGVLKAFNNLRDHNEPYLVGLRESQAARSIVDWTIGANFTVLCTRKFGPYDNQGKQQMLSIGRVQTATLAIVVQREKEILNFKPQISYAVEALFGAASGEYKGVWKRRGTEGDKEETRFSTEAEAKAFVDGLRGNRSVIQAVNYKVTKEAPPLLFDLGAIQTEGSKRFKYSVQQVLDTIQELYQKQYLSYPRTEDRYLTPAVAAELPDILQALPKEYSTLVPSRMTAARKPGNRIVSTDPMPHHAIIPTKQAPNMSSLTTMQRNIYDLVVRSVLAALSEYAEWGRTEIVTTIGTEPFYTSGKMLVKAGWRDVYGLPASKEDLPTVTKGEAVTTKKLEAARKETKPPKRLTDAELRKAMENAGNYVDDDDDDAKEVLKSVAGIGTSATRAAIINRLLEIGYLNQDAKTMILTPTDKAFQLIDQVPVDAVKSPKYTAEIESYLAEIVDGKRTKEEVVRTVEDFIRKASEQIKAMPSLPRPMVMTTGSKSGSSAGAGKKSPAKSTSSTSASTGKSGGTGTRGKSPADIPCPSCGSKIIEHEKFFGCSNYRGGCKVAISKEIAGHKLTKSEVTQLLSKGKTSKKVKFVKSGGKEYEEFLVMHEGRAVQEWIANKSAS